MNTEDTFNCDVIHRHNWAGFRRINERSRMLYACQMHMTEGFSVKENNGVVQVGKCGDYLIINMNDEKFVCDKEVFEKTYEFIDDKPITR